jgi:DNA-binding NtrC family response regulator
MLRGHQVLIVEDEPLIALDLEQALSTAGAQVAISGTVDSALEAAEAPAVTAAIIDLRLHGQSVRSVVERLATRDLPFIFYSGHTETPTAASWPSVPFLVKPLPAGQVVDMLARVVSAKSGRSSSQDDQDEKGGPV